MDCDQSVWLQADHTPLLSRSDSNLATERKPTLIEFQFQYEPLQAVTQLASQSQEMASLGYGSPSSPTGPTYPSHNMTNGQSSIARSIHSSPILLPAAVGSVKKQSHIGVFVQCPLAAGKVFVPYRQPLTCSWFSVSPLLDAVNATPCV